MSGTRRHPVLAAALVVLAALVPAAALAGLWRWADEEADAAETVPTTTTIPAPEPAEPLRTPLLSMRRAPAPLVETAMARAATASAEPLAARLGATSCATVSIGGELVAAINPDVAVIPASNQKLLVGAVALDQLGADFRYRTEVRAAGIVDGVVQGDLYVVGAGDPVLQTADRADWQEYPATTTTSLDALADAVVAAGVTSVTGNVVGDGSRYDDEFFVPAWAPDVRVVEAGPYDALLVNDGRLPGGEAGFNPNQSAASELNRLLRARGVTVGGRNRNGPTPPEAQLVVASVESAPMRDIVAEMLLTSDDNTAELLVKELGAARAGAGTRAAGLGVVRDVLASWGLPLDGVVFDDGSGLSRENRVTCRLLVGVLEHVGEDSDLAAGLPVAGVSGTLADAFVGTPSEGRVRAKTGTLTDVKALSGFTPAAEGTAAFALVLNEPGVDDDGVYPAVWQQLVDLAASLPPTVDVDTFGPR